MINIKYQALAFAALLMALTTSHAFKVEFIDTFSIPIHENITSKAIGERSIRLANNRVIKFTSDALAYIQEANTESDELHLDAPDYHFDDDSFWKSTSNLVAWKEAAAAAAIKGEKYIRSNYTNVSWTAPGALDWLGRSLHLVQDFYAHSSWVDIKEVNQKLRHPRFGQADVLNRIALGDAGVLRADLNESVATCDAAGYITTSMLTTGYYDVGMSLADFGLAGRALLMGKFPHIQKYPSFINNTDGRAGLGFYTKEWKAMINDYWPEISNHWLDSRCIHGGDTGPGLNKDMPGRPKHKEAYQAAITGSAMFLDEVIAEIRKTGGKDADRAVCALLEYTPLSDCDMPNELGTVDLFTGDSATAFIDVPIRFVVVGSNIPGSAVVRMENATCALNTFQTSSGFTAICWPYKPGNSKVEVIGAFGDAILKSISYNIESADLQAYPSIREIYQKISFTLSNVYLNAKVATWRITDALYKIAMEDSFDVKETVSHVFKKAGEWTIEVFFLDAARKPLGLGVSKDIKVYDSVSGTANITSVKTASGVDIQEAGSTSEQRPKLSGTISAPISNHFSVWVYLDDVRLAPATVDGTAWTYTATSDIPVGAHKFTVAVVRFDSVEGAKSAPRSLTVVGSDANTGLIAHFPFDGSLADRVRPGAVGLLVAQKTPPVFESGSNGQAVQLTPPNALAGSYLRGTALVTTDTSFTIAATVKPNGIAANGVNALVFQRTDLGGDAQGCSGNAYNFGLAIYLGRWMFQVSTLQGGACIHATIYAPIQPVVGRYYRVAGVYDKSAGKARLYVDGLLVGEQAAGSSFRITPNMVTTVGNQPWASPPQPANASIDDLRVYTRALTPAELPKDQWNAFNDYSLLANPSGPWRYAFQAAESGISPMTAAAANCGDLGLSCWKRSADSVGLPMVAINSSDAVHRNRTLVIPPNMLVLHPGIAEERAVIEFSAPADGRYKFTGRWEIVDTNPSGVKLTWAGPRGTGASTLLNGYAATSPISVSLNLLAGEKVSFSVDANGNYGNDSTGLVLQVTNQGTADPALVGYWSFDDCTAADNSGSGGNGLLVGSPVCEQGVAGSGMKLNSTNWIDVPSRPSLEFTSSFTISVWFKADALTTEKSVRLVDKTAAGLSDGYLLSVWASGLSLVGGPNGAVSDLTTISSNVFHHAVVTFGNGIANFYLDGKPIGSRSVGAMSVTVNADRVLRIGASQGPAAHPTLNNFVGVIDEVRLYNTTLSSSDVSDLYRVTSKIGASSGSITILANTIPGSMLTVPAGVSSCAFTSTGTWSAGPNAPPQYQNADGVIGTTSYNLTDFGVPIPSAPNMALVVQHSSTGKWDLLGSSKTISVQAGETLSFMMNDATTFGYADGNTGQLSTIWTCN